MRRWQPLVIVITGSVAKTNLLHILKEQLGQQAAYSYRANTKVGIACDIFDMPPIEAGRRWRWLVLAIGRTFQSLVCQG